MSYTVRDYRPVALMLCGFVLVVIGISEGRLPDIDIPVIVWSWWGVAKVGGFLMILAGLVLPFVLLWLKIRRAAP